MRKSLGTKETIWRERLTQQAASGKAISKFCRDESISVSNFYAWRARLTKPYAKAVVPASKSPAAFIDLGTLKDTDTHKKVVAIPTPTAPQNLQSTHLLNSSIQVQLDLGNGMVLTIARA